MRSRRGIRAAAGAPRGKSGKPIEGGPERIANLVKDFERARERLMIPTPALSEVLVKVDPVAAQRILETINKSSVFRVESFDLRAAIETAALARDDAPGAKRKRRRLSDADTYARLKYDRQIIAIARVNRAKAIYTDDRGLRDLATRLRIAVYGLGDLELPPESAQPDLPFPTDRTPAPE